MEIFLIITLLIVVVIAVILNYRLVKELEEVKKVCNRSLKYYESKLMKEESFKDFTKEEVDALEFDLNRKYNNDNSFKMNLNYVYEKNEVISVNNKDT